MTDEDGREVYVDLVRHPHAGVAVEAFDGWRISYLVLDDGGDHPLATEDDLLAVCEQLASLGELRVIEPGRWSRCRRPPD